MTPEQKAAYINAQTALLNAEIAGMVAINQFFEHHAEQVAYDEADFLDTVDRYPMLKADAIKAFFEDTEVL